MSDVREEAIQATARAASDRTLTFTYRNWRGEVAERKVVPIHVWFGTTDWHPEPQWFLNANDLDKGETRDFAMKDIGAASPQPPSPEPVASGPPFVFERYINGSLMAEGVTIEKATTLEAAMVKAAKIASRGPKGEAPVLVCAPPDTAAIRAQARADFADELCVLASEVGFLDVTLIRERADVRPEEKGQADG